MGEGIFKIWSDKTEKKSSNIRDNKKGKWLCQNDWVMLTIMTDRVPSENPSPQKHTQKKSEFPKSINNKISIKNLFEINFTPLWFSIS